MHDDALSGGNGVFASGKCFAFVHNFTIFNDAFLLCGNQIANAAKRHAFFDCFALVNDDVHTLRNDIFRRSLLATSHLHHGFLAFDDDSCFATIGCIHRLFGKHVDILVFVFIHLDNDLAVIRSKESIWRGDKYITTGLAQATDGDDSVDIGDASFILRSSGFKEVLNPGQAAGDVSLFDGHSGSLTKDVSLMHKASVFHAHYQAGRERDESEVAIFCHNLKLRLFLAVFGFDDCDIPAEGDIVIFFFERNIFDEVFILELSLCGRDQGVVKLIPR